MRARQSGKVRERYAGLTTNGVFNGVVRFQSQELTKPLRTRKPTTFAVWNDLFHPCVTEDQIAEALAVMSEQGRHTFFVLTKRAGCMRKFFAEAMAPQGANGRTLVHSWPTRNVFIGVTCEDQQRADERIPDLLATPAAVRWLSLEPLLGPIDLKSVNGMASWPVDVLTGGTWALGKGTAIEGFCQHSNMSTVSWVVVGPETGPRRRPCDPEWIRTIVEQCRSAGVPVWVKAFPVNGRVSHDMSEWPEWARLREMPEAGA